MVRYRLFIATEMWEFSDTSAAHGIVKTINEMTANLQILDVGVDTSTTTGSLVLNLLGAVAQFEREMMLERQREGIAKAKSEGKYKGRKATARAKADDILTMKSQGIGPSEIARTLKIGRAFVYRIMAEQAA